MPRDVSGNYTLPGGDNPVVSGTVITSSWANTTMDDLAVALTDSLSRTGDGGMLTALPFTDGSAGNPSITFTSDTTTGRYMFAPGDMRDAVQGVDVLRYNNGVITLWVDPDWISVIQNAQEVTYDNTASGLTAVNVQDAIDELDTAVDTNTTNIGTNTTNIGTNTTNIGTNTSAIALKAPIASPTFTGVPLAPTAAPGTNTTQLATTAFVQAAINSSTTANTATGRYIILPDGLMIQWATISDNVSSGTWTFPLPFAAVIYAKGLTPASSQNLGSITSIRQTAGSTNSSIDWFKTTGDTIDLFAIGY